MDTAKITALAVPVGLAYAVYKYVESPAIKTAALSVLAVVIAKQLPVIGTALA